jgi:hypothetical protein
MRRNCVVVTHFMNVRLIVSEEREISTLVYRVHSVSTESILLLTCIIYYPVQRSTSPTSGGRSVGIVRSRTQTMEFSLVLVQRRQFTICYFCMLLVGDDVEHRPTFYHTTSYPGRQWSLSCRNWISEFYLVGFEARKGWCALICSFPFVVAACCFSCCCCCHLSGGAPRWSSSVLPPELPPWASRSQAVAIRLDIVSLRSLQLFSRLFRPCISVAVYFSVRVLSRERTLSDEFFFGTVAIRANVFSKKLEMSRAWITAIRRGNSCTLYSKPIVMFVGIVVLLQKCSCSHLVPSVTL